MDTWKPEMHFRDVFKMYTDDYIREFDQHCFTKVWYRTI